MTSLKSRIGRIVSFTRVCFAAGVKEALFAKLEADSRINLELEMLHVSL